MKIPRHVVARKNQHLVAIPAELRAHLGLVAGAVVWWHIGRKGQAALTVTGRIRAGRPTKDEECPSCKHYRDELDRLRRELREGEAATPRQWWRQGYARANADLGNIKAEVEMCVRLLQEVLRDRRRGRGSSAPTRGHRNGARRTAEVVPAPILQEQKSELAPVGATTPPE